MSSSGATFEFEGETFPYVTDPGEFTLDEMDTVLGWLWDIGLISDDGEDTEASLAKLNTPRHRMKLLKVLMWASVHRRRPEFTLAQAGAVDVDVVTTTKRATPRKTPADRKPPAGAVLSPTKRGASTTRKRAAPRTTSNANAAGTGRRSRGSITSPPSISED